MCVVFSDVPVACFTDAFILTPVLKSLCALLTFCHHHYILLVDTPTANSTHTLSLVQTA
eukprot:m.18677 g.18677  ORF g.18677 m.18677 type:complete len:59 (+) comp7925_c1_seq1:325-501(+)